jgi:hypothetical protein
MGKDRCSKGLGLALFILAVPVEANAATIFGKLYRDGKPMGPGIAVVLTCPQASSPATGLTDATGSYQISINAAGRCSLTVNAASVEVVLSEQIPKQFDFDLRNGSLLRR